MAIHFILIVGRHDLVKNYKNAVASAGFIPVITDSFNLIKEWEKHPDNAILSRMDLLLLPGGGDISPDLIHMEKEGFRNIDRQLDQMQFSYLEHFLLRQKPVLGICKGMQVINAKLGGTLIPDMDKEQLSVHAYQNEKDSRHDCTYVSIDEFEDFPTLPVLRHLYKSPLLPSRINSAHHQCIARLPHTLQAFQYSPDGIIEGFIHRYLPIMGLQWHPERLFGPEGSYMKLFLNCLLSPVLLKNPS